MNASTYQYDFEQVSDHMKMVAVSEAFNPEFYSQECESRWEILDNKMKNDTWMIHGAGEASMEELRVAEDNINMVNGEH